MPMTLVSTVTLTNSSTTQIDFASIAQTGKDLLLVVSARSTTASTFVDLNFIVNDIQTGYSNLRLRGTGTAVSSTSQNGNSIFHPTMNASSAAANTFGSTQVYIANYATSYAKLFSIDSVTEDTSSSAEIRLVASNLSVGAITKVTTYDSSGGAFASGTTASLYIIS